VLDHVICQSSLDSSIERFEALSNRIFASKPYSFMLVLQQLINWLVLWFSDNKYDSGTLDDVVQEAFGVHQRLFDFASQPQTGVKVAVTASTVSSSQLRLFTNYNGVARARQGRGTYGPRSTFLFLTVFLRLCYFAASRSCLGALLVGDVSILPP
jgi:hypothetical protein